MWFPAALLSSVFYASLWLFARASRGNPSSAVTALSALGGPVLLLFVAQRIDFPWHETWWYFYLLIPMLILPLILWAMTTASQRTDVTIIKPLSALSTLTALLFASFVFGERFALTGILGAIVITAGLLTLYHGRWYRWHEPWPWVILLCSLLLGCNVAILGKVLTLFPHPIAVSALSQTGIFFFLSIAAGRAWKRMRFNRRLVILLAGFAVATLGQDIATLIALSLGPAPYVIAVKRTSILLAALGGYFLFHEKDQPLWRLMLSGMIVVGGVALLNT